MSPVPVGGSFDIINNITYLCIAQLAFDELSRLLFIAGVISLSLLYLNHKGP